MCIKRSGIDAFLYDFQVGWCDGIDLLTISFSFVAVTLNCFFACND